MCNQFIKSKEALRMDKDDIKKKAAEVAATFALSGMDLTEIEERNGRAILEGRKTAREAIEEGQKIYAKGAGDE
jgi:hypothetical protein